MLIHLARSANLPEGLYILPSVSFFFYISFLMISRRQIIWRSTGPIFAIFTLNESILAVDDRSGPLFSISKGRCHGNRFYAKNGKLPIFVALAFRNDMGYRYINGRVNSGIDACILYENFVKFGPVTPELKELIWERLVWQPKNGPIWSNIFGSTGRIFAIFTPYERALRADDGSVAFFQFIKGRCHGNQIMLRKCINVDWYHLHSVH